jgi:hypothetical protein
MLILEIEKATLQSIPSITITIPCKQSLFGNHAAANRTEIQRHTGIALATTQAAL